jgi:KUP system potassium uptake protein
MVALTLTTLGVVFGDIGTSPLYALQAVFSANDHAVRPDNEGVFGVISLVFWTITLVVSVKYVTFVMRLDNNGEGGIMALIALLQATPVLARSALVGVGIFGAALFYGDGMITPAISVLSAVEGLRVATPSLGSLVVPSALVVLILLFGVQRYGTGAVGRLFAPVMAVWFAALALSGLREVIEHPEIVEALSSAHGVTFLADHRGIALIVLAAVVLTVTGAEALYADVGHFGRSPIRRAWFLVVFPALTLNYMGQGALVLHAPGAVESPFFLLFPPWARLPTVILATAATVIASQAVISGAFSLTHQAIQLGFLPRLTIRHTSEREVGQVYSPAVNWILCVAVAGLVVGFGSSAHLASAYGIAVTGTMAITTVLFLFILRTLRKQRRWVVLSAAAAFLTVDLALFTATLTKAPDGGWLSLTVGLVVLTILTTWRRGHEIVASRVLEEEGPLRSFVEELRARESPVHRVPGSAVFLTATRDTTPLALRANVEHNHVLHQSVVIVLMTTLNVPHIPPSERIVVDDLGYRDDGITHLTARFGFRDAHRVPQSLRLAAAQGLERSIDIESASYFVSRIAIIPTDAPGMHPWRKALFVAMARNEADAGEYFAIPEDRSVVIGSVIEL